MVTWKDFPRTKDNLVILGFAETTRNMVPWDRDDFEVWIVNEEYRYDWVKRFDRIFQLHPRWDFTRKNNLNDPNHFLWLKNEVGICNWCEGRGFVEVVEGNEKVQKSCQFCDHGTYTPQRRPENLPIYMQRSHPDIPNSIAIPLQEMTDTYLTGMGRHYYTSSVAYMLPLAHMMGFKTVMLYGFEMGSTTEYHYQKSNFEFWCGLLMAKGMNILVPRESSLLTGLLYGYENMRTGYRQQLEMRQVNLKQQIEIQKNRCLELKGQTLMAHKFHVENPENEDIKALFVEKRNELSRNEGIANFIAGALRESENLTTLYDMYFKAGTEQGDGEDVEAYEENRKFVNLVYASQEGNNDTEES